MSLESVWSLKYHFYLALVLGCHMMLTVNYDSSRRREAALHPIFCTIVSLNLCLGTVVVHVSSGCVFRPVFCVGLLPIAYYTIEIPIY